MRDYLRQLVKENGDRDDDIILQYIDSLPNKLYRFRECNENNFESLEKDYIWLTTADKFDDYLDTTFRFDFAKQRKDILKVFYDMSPDIAVKGLTEELSKKGIEAQGEFYNVDNLKLMRDKYISSRGKLDQKGLRIELLSKGYNNKALNLFESILKKYFSEDNLSKQADKMVKRFKRKVRQIRKRNYISCLSETYKNNMMWERYGDNHKGFCIGYDLITDKYDDIKFQISPIYYGRKDALDLPGLFEYSFKKYCYKYEDQAFVDKLSIEMNLQIRSKDMTYSHEKEWRYVKFNEKRQNRRQKFPFVKSIILGCNISSHNKRRLLEIAKEKGIDVYMERLNEVDSRYYYDLHK